MKQLFFVLFLACSFQLSAQVLVPINEIVCAYDASGNRIIREQLYVIDGGQKPAHQASNSLPLAEVRVYPNPTADLLYVESQPHQGVLYCYELYTLEGRLLTETRQEAARVQLDVANLVAGTYLLAIRQGGTIVHSQKVVKE